MRKSDEIRSYFAHPGFERFLTELERKHRASRNGARGSVVLNDIRDDEREKLDGFFGVYSPPVKGETRSYSVLKFNKLLLESRFQLTIPELLAVLRGRPVLTRLEEEVQSSAGWRGIISAAMEQAGLEPADLEKASLEKSGLEKADQEKASLEKSGLEKTDQEKADVEKTAPFQTGDDVVRRWAIGVLEEAAPGSRTFRTMFAQSPQEAQRCMVHCLRALRRVASSRGMGDRPIRLPVLAAQVTGDAHALDWKYPLGRLFWWGLTSITGHTPGDWLEDASGEQLKTETGHTQAMMIREGYRRGGVADDDLSSQVLLYAPELFGVCEERVLTLRQVEAIQPEQIDRLSAKHILMVENPSVFAELIDASVRKTAGIAGPTEAGVRKTAGVGGPADTSVRKSAGVGGPADTSVRKSAGVTEPADTNIHKTGQSAGSAAAAPIILCGNGQPTTAVIRLLDILLAQPGERKLQYAGDLDPAGLGIAHSLEQRYKSAFCPWLMDRGVFTRYAQQGIPMDDKEKARLQEYRGLWDMELVDAMLASGMKLHQELWLDELLRDQTY
ncbi:TIGR02679 domain-containing protein [Paenibacillus senegalensis]|uniref:TIGR02679 domain-containing protein n=1 Tax=Paenibacillus senegalensis TaxID=1465766 RepID=UPI0002885C9B|nr:TIGR02679 domain-containing protein [Paenibacillus senegalensis]